MNFFFSSVCILLLLSNHPIYILVIVNTIAVRIRFIIFLLIKNVWFSIVLIIVFSSGLIISFSYIVSLVPNELTFKNAFSYLVLIYPLGINLLLPFFYNHSFQFISYFFHLNRENILIITFFLFLFLLICTSIIYNPLKSIKRLFYEKFYFYY